MRICWSIHIYVSFPILRRNKANKSLLEEFKLPLEFNNITQTISIFILKNFCRIDSKVSTINADILFYRLPSSKIFISPSIKDLFELLMLEILRKLLLLLLREVHLSLFLSTVISEFISLDALFISLVAK